MTKRQVIANFNHAASTYEDYNQVQQRVQTLLTPHFPSSPAKRILELGCGSGNGVNHILKTYPKATIFAVDSGIKLIQKAEMKPWASNHIHWIVADIEDWAFPSELDVIWSNASLQWIEDHQQLAKKCAEALTDNGQLIATLFGPKTNQELGVILKDVTGETWNLPATHFRSIDALKSDYEQHFKTVTIEEHMIEMSWTSMLELMKTIKYTGTKGTGVNQKKFWTPGFVNACEKAFKARYNGVSVSYETYLLKASL